MAKQPEIVRSPKREVIGILLLALCLLSFLCVFSFHAEDICWLHTPPASPPYNLVGPLGAWFAYVGFLLFGVNGYLLPFVLMTGGLMMTFRSYERGWPVWAWLTAGLTTLSGLAEYQAPVWQSLTNYLGVGSPGGVIGEMLAIRTLGRLVGHTGAGVLFVTVLLLAVLQLTGLHPFTPFLFLWEKIKEWNLRRKEAHAERVVESKLGGAPAKSAGKTKPAKVAKPAAGAPASASRPEPKPEPPAEPDGLFAVSADPRPEPLKAEPPSAPRTEPKAEPKTEAPKPPSKPKPAVALADEPTFMSVNIAPGRDESGYQLPPLTILDELPPAAARASSENTEEKIQILQAKLEEFRVDGRVTHVETGPTVTSYEITPGPGVRVESIANLEKNIALALRAQSIRIQAPIPGKGAVGIEVPNTKSTSVYLRELAESPAFHSPDVALPLALGKDVSGRIVVGDLSSMPHLLIAGATGAGKTVCMNSLLTGLLLSRTPEQLRLILVDPKTFEFQAYENLKHLVVPIITDAKKVALGLRWAIKEMEKRYSLFKRVKVRDIKGFNSRPVEKQVELFGAAGEPSEAAAEQIPARLPYIVIVVDELAELMGVAQQEIEPCIVRLAQLSRAAGIHMVLATQRPSVNVITGTIKANIPGRIAFQVAQGNDSRTILDTIGAEKLLGRGDMLYLPPGKSKPVRLQGTWTSDGEMHRVTDFIRTQGTPEFITDIRQKIDTARPDLPDMDESDDLLEAAVEVLRSTKRASTSSLQRRLKIGYNRAARLMDILEEKGIIGPPTETGPRDILIDLDGGIPDHAGAPAVAVSLSADLAGPEDDDEGGDLVEDEEDPFSEELSAADFGEAEDEDKPEA
jgi:S-DNA-T family DNA segregation ATPase FtsK/SpoIIIE